jgi:hypothetical protein
MKITLYNYLMWIAKDDENEITSAFLADQLQIDNMTDDELMKFYHDHKDNELREFKEEYGNGHENSLENYYESLKCNSVNYNTTITFFIGDEFFELKEVNGSYLHDNRHLLPPLPKDKMVEWAEKLLGEYVLAFDEIENRLSLHHQELVGNLGVFVEEYLKSHK